MNVTNLEHLEKLEMALEGAKDVIKQVPISKDHGSPNFSFRVFTVPAQRLHAVSYASFRAYELCH